MHAFSVGVPVIGSITGVSLDMFHQKLFFCGIEPYPMGCEGIECIVGKNALVFMLWAAAIWIMITFMIEIVCMGLIYHSVRKRERIINSFSFRGRDGRILSQSSPAVSIERRDTGIQAILYIAAFLLTYMWPFMVGFLIRAGYFKANFPFLLLSGFFLPLFGFWLFVAYMRPRYIKLRRENKSLSVVAKIKIILFSINTRPMNRRAST
jgi:hypothetical protein